MPHRRQDPPERRAPPQRPGTAEPAAPEQPNGVEGVIALQRTAGNAAVGALLSTGDGARGGILARQSPPATAAGPATIADLDAALDHWDVDEEAVIDLLGRLSATDKATVLAGGYQDPLAAALSTAEMVRAVRALDAPLGQALEWVSAAAGGWSDIDYSEIATLVQHAPQPQRDALKTTPWRDRFVGICTNATMQTAVTELAFDLRTKIDWMLEEGTSKDQLAMVIRTTPAAELPLVTADAALLQRLQDDLSAAEYAEIDKMLRHGLLGESDIEREYVGHEYHVWAALYRSGLTLHKAVTYTAAGGLTTAQLNAYKTAVQTGVTRHMSGKWKLRVASPGGTQEGDGDYPINFNVYERSDSYPITVHAGQGRDSTGEDAAEWYEGGMAGDTADMLIAVHAHELGHLMLGAPEEYAAAPGDTHDPGRTVTRDNSVMGDINAGNATNLEIRDRHVSFLAPWAQQFFPGRNVSIVR